MSLSHRSSHYGLWFLIFGLIPLIEVLRHSYGANPPTYEAFWLLGTGLLGLLLGNRNLNDGKLAKPYDVLVGLVFTFAGVVGIVGDFGAHRPAQHHHRAHRPVAWRPLAAGLYLLGAQVAAPRAQREGLSPVA